MTENEWDERLSRPDAGVVETLRKHPGDIAVLGAGGKMGFHLCRMLQRALESLGRKDCITAISRFAASQKRAAFETSGIRVHAADLSDDQQVAGLPEAEMMFFLAGVKFGTADNPEILETMNVRMPQKVAKQYRDARIVALSTGCVYSFMAPESGGSKESDPTDPPGAYAQSCIGREQAFMDNSLRFGTPTSIIRLNYSNECRYGVLYDIASAVWDEREVQLETGYVNVIWQRDAVSYTIRALEQAASPAFVLNVTGEKILSVREIAMGFSKRFRKPAHFTGCEAETAWLNNAERCHRLFGPPEATLEQMMDWIAEWVSEGKPSLGKPTHFQTRDGDY